MPFYKALYTYDFFLTLPLEVEIVWGYEMTKNMALLLLNRYLTLLVDIPILVLLFNRHGKFGIEVVSLIYVPSHP